MKHLRLLPSVALVSLLAACGGGSHSSGGPVVTQATPPANSGSSGNGNDGGTTTTTPPPQAGSVQTLTATTVVAPSNAGSVVDQAALPSADAQVTIDPTAKTITIASQKYQINDTVTPTDAATFFANAANWSNVKNSQYPNGYATIASSGKLTSPNDGLQYSEYGLWQSATASGVLRGAYASGQQTLAQNMPKTGSATYVGSAQALATIPDSTNGNVPYGLTMGAQITANWAQPTNNVTATFSNIQATSLHSGITPPDLTNSQLQYTATVSGNTYSGATVSGNLAGNAIASGNIAGQFNGPTANETVGVFNGAGSSGSGVNLTGSYGATKH